MTEVLSGELLYEREAYRLVLEGRYLCGYGKRGEEWSLYVCSRCPPSFRSLDFARMLDGLSEYDTERAKRKLGTSGGLACKWGSCD